MAKPFRILTPLGIALLFVITAVTSQAQAVDRATVRIFDRGRLCRSMEMALTRSKYLKPTFEDLGASDATLSSFTTDLTALKTAACAGNVRTATVLSKFAAFGRTWGRMFQDVADEQNLSVDDAKGWVFARMEYEAGRLMTGCGGDAEAAAGYVRNGTGSLFQSALGPTCNASQSVGGVRAEVRIVSPEPETIASCISNAVARSANCSGWAGQPPSTGGGEDPEPPPPEEVPPEEADKDATGTPIADAALEGADLAKDIGTAVIGVGGMITITAGGGPRGKAAGGFVVMIGTGIKFVGETTSAIVKHFFKDKPSGGGAKQCPAATFGSKVAYAANPDGTATSNKDVYQQCLCNAATVAANREFPAVGGGFSIGGMVAYGLFDMVDSGFCMSGAAAAQLNCVKNPFSGNDGIRRECRGLLMQNNAGLQEYDIASRCSQLIQCPIGNFRYNLDTSGTGAIGCRCTPTDGSEVPGGGGGGGGGDRCRQVTCADGRIPVWGASGCRCPVSTTPPIVPPIPPGPGPR